MAAKKEQTLSFEEAMTRLEKIVVSMEQGEVPLEQSLALFAEGTELLKQCTTLLDKAEQQVTRLVRNKDGSLQEVPFAKQGE